MSQRAILISKILEKKKILQQKFEKQEITMRKRGRNDVVTTKAQMHRPIDMSQQPKEQNHNELERMPLRIAVFPQIHASK